MWMHAALERRCGACGEVAAAACGGRGAVDNASARGMERGRPRVPGRRWGRAPRRTAALQSGGCRPGRRPCPAPLAHSSRSARCCCTRLADGSIERGGRSAATGSARAPPRTSEPARLQRTLTRRRAAGPRGPAARPAATAIAAAALLLRRRLVPSLAAPRRVSRRCGPRCIARAGGAFPRAPRGQPGRACWPILLWRSACC
jgi:hypothetical protein